MEEEGEREWEREGEEKREGRARLGDDEPALFRVAFVASAVMAGSGRGSPNNIYLSGRGCVSRGLAVWPGPVPIHTGPRHTHTSNTNDSATTSTHRR